MYYYFFSALFYNFADFFRVYYKWDISKLVYASFVFSIMKLLFRLQAGYANPLSVIYLLVNVKPRSNDLYIPVNRCDVCQ